MMKCFPDHRLQKKHKKLQHFSSSEQYHITCICDCSELIFLALHDTTYLTEHTDIELE